MFFTKNRQSVGGEVGGEVAEMAEKSDNPLISLGFGNVAEKWRRSGEVGLSA
jgi:hypothetical protein